jgi:hypothetical protein
VHYATAIAYSWWAAKADGAATAGVDAATARRRRRAKAERGTAEGAKALARTPRQEPLVRAAVAATRRRDSDLAGTVRAAALAATDQDAGPAAMDLAVTAMAADDDSAATARSVHRVSVRATVVLLNRAILT